MQCYFDGDDQYKYNDDCEGDYEEDIARLSWMYIRLNMPYIYTIYTIYILYNVKWLF